MTLGRGRWQGGAEKWSDKGTFHLPQEQSDSAHVPLNCQEKSSAADGHGYARLLSGFAAFPWIKNNAYWFSASNQLTKQPPDSLGTKVSHSLPSV